MHLVITDSGLGGLTVCASLEAALRGRRGPVRLTYVNAWPETGRGYNDLPDLDARARVFERVLARLAAMDPDAVLIACNTLSIIYEHTRFRTSAPMPVHGIVDGGVELFREALDSTPASSLVLIGTRTTIDSGVHRARLVRRGIATARIGGASCHGLATAIERGPDSETTATMISTCAGRAATEAPPGEPLWLGLACTHYGIVADRIVGALTARVRRTVRALDPNTRMVSDMLARLPGPRGGGSQPARVDVLSKVELTEGQRDGVARLLEASSPATAAALRGYTHRPDLF